MVSFHRNFLYQVGYADCCFTFSKNFIMNLFCFWQLLFLFPIHVLVRFNAYKIRFRQKCFHWNGQFVCCIHVCCIHGTLLNQPRRCLPLENSKADLEFYLLLAAMTGMTIVIPSIPPSSGFWCLPHQDEMRSVKEYSNEAQKRKEGERRTKNHEAQWFRIRTFILKY